MVKKRAALGDFKKRGLNNTIKGEGVLEKMKANPFTALSNGGGHQTSGGKIFAMG